MVKRIVILKLIVLLGFVLFLDASSALANSTAKESNDFPFELKKSIDGNMTIYTPSPIQETDNVSRIGQNILIKILGADITFPFPTNYLPCGLNYEILFNRSDETIKDKLLYAKLSFEKNKDDNLVYFPARFVEGKQSWQLLFGVTKNQEIKGFGEIVFPLNVPGIYRVIAITVDDKRFKSLFDVDTGFEMGKDNFGDLNWWGYCNGMTCFASWYFKVIRTETKHLFNDISFADVEDVAREAHEDVNDGLFNFLSFLASFVASIYGPDNFGFNKTFLITYLNMKTLNVPQPLGIMERNWHVFKTAHSILAIGYDASSSELIVYDPNSFSEQRVSYDFLTGFHYSGADGAKNYSYFIPFFDNAVSTLEFSNIYNTYKN